MQNSSDSQPTRRSLLAMTAAGLLADTLQPILAGPHFRGCIPRADVETMLARESLTLDALMLSLLPVAKSLAHPPLSNYFVGAVALGRSRNLYLGANIEVPANILGLAVHAEQAAIANAYMSREQGIDAIAVTAAPCGHCRQFLSELSLDASMRVLINNAPAVALSDPLPKAFGPRDLGFKEGALPARRGRIAPNSSAEVLVAKATEAAAMSYAPYTLSPSGVALATSNGRVFSGSYIENAAFNPSLPPLQAALAGYFAAGANAGKIQRVVLVEGGKNRISQESAARSTLTALAPAASFEAVKQEFL